jgi:hypothetical protein
LPEERNADAGEQDAGQVHADDHAVQEQVVVRRQHVDDWTEGGPSEVHHEADNRDREDGARGRVAPSPHDRDDQADAGEDGENRPAAVVEQLAAHEPTEDLARAVRIGPERAGGQAVASPLLVTERRDQ